MMVFTFPVFDWSYFFGANLVLKMKIVCLSWNFGTYINSNKQNSMVLFTFSVFNLQVLFKKSIWHVDVTWKLSQQFICRDLKPVAFLLYWNFVKQRDLQYGKKTDQASDNHLQLNIRRIYWRVSIKQIYKTILKVQ